jgi:hypothetical protein
LIFTGNFDGTNRTEVLSYYTDTNKITWSVSPRLRHYLHSEKHWGAFSPVFASYNGIGLRSDVDRRSNFAFDYDVIFWILKNSQRAFAPVYTPPVMAAIGRGWGEAPTCSSRESICVH